VGALELAERLRMPQSRVDQLDASLGKPMALTRRRRQETPRPESRSIAQPRFDSFASVSRVKLETPARDDTHSSTPVLTLHLPSGRASVSAQYVCELPSQTT
jgi:hypothetical protein